MQADFHSENSLSWKLTKVAVNSAEPDFITPFFYKVLLVCNIAQPFAGLFQNENRGCFYSRSV